jgi:hypothetical protein
MRYRYVITIAVFSVFACQGKVERSAIPELVELEIIDSIEIKETEYFLNGQKNVNMLGNSLIAV